MYFVDLFLMYIIFSFLGWVIETIYCSSLEKRFIHRGFLNGPVCPIYGTGALAVGIPLSYVKIHPVLDIFLVFVLGLVICSIVEYLISLVLEKIFKIKLWDYSSRPLNLHGRIWIGYSLGWGVMSLFLVYLINPFFSRLLVFLPQNIKVILTIFLFIITLTDVLFTIFNIQAISKKLGERRIILTFPHFTIKKFSEQIKLIKNKIKIERKKK